MFNEDTYTIPNWDLNPALESEVYLSQGIYDALNRPIIQRTGRTGKAMSSVDYTYNEAGLLESVKANSSQKGLKDYVKSIDYNEKGQRKTIVYGNNTKTSYSYDKNTFRLAQIRTLNGIDKVQDLNYTYDPVGNISTVVNLAEDTIFFKNQNVEPSNSYVYDAIYRLTQATGREHIGQAGVHANTPDSQTDIFRINLPHPGNGTALQNYKQNYNYGPTGNMQMMRHVAGLGNLTHRWTKTFGYNNNDHDRQQLGVPLATKKNNQLLEYKQGTNSQQYDFDLHGNMQSIQPNTASEKFDLSWNCFDQLKHINILAGTAHYWYDASGERSRKVLTDGTNITRERIYFFGLEVYREYHSNKTVKLERESFHIHDDTGRIALVDTKTIDHPSDDTQEQLIRYQYSNHIGSSSLELDAVGRIISYEEYYPYGTTSYQAVNQTIKSAAKRYRYTGMERDDESGLNYHSARYYLPWLCRWANPDPIGIGDGVNLFRYTQNNPVRFKDSTGKYSWGEFFEDVGEGVKGAAKGIVEPVLLTYDIGQTIGAVAAHKITGDDAYLDVNFASGTAKRIEGAKDPQKEAFRASAVLITAIPTGGGSVLVDNVAQVFEKDMSPEEAQRFLTRGAVSQVAATGLGVGISKTTGSGWTGRGPNNSGNAALVEKLVNERVASGEISTGKGGPSGRTTSVGRNAKGQETQVRKSPVEGGDPHAEPQTLGDVGQFGGRTVVVDQVPCGTCRSTLGAPKEGSPGLFDSSITGSLKVLTPRKVSNPTGSPKGATIRAAKARAKGSPEIELVPLEEFTIPFAPPTILFNSGNGIVDDASTPIDELSYDNNEGIIILRF